MKRSRLEPSCSAGIKIDAVGQTVKGSYRRRRLFIADATAVVAVARHDVTIINLEGNAAMAQTATERPPLALPFSLGVLIEGSNAILLVAPHAPHHATNIGHTVGRRAGTDKVLITLAVISGLFIVKTNGGRQTSTSQSESTSPATGEAGKFTVEVDDATGLLGWGLGADRDGLVLGGRTLPGIG